MYFTSFLCVFYHHFQNIIVASEMSVECNGAQLMENPAELLASKLTVLTAVAQGPHFCLGTKELDQRFGPREGQRSHSKQKQSEAPLSRNFKGRAFREG